MAATEILLKVSHNEAVSGCVRGGTTGAHPEHDSALHG